MHGLRGAVAEAGEVVAFEDVEGAEQDNAAGGGGRGAEDGVVVEKADDRRALDDGVAGQVFEGEQGAALFEVVDQLTRHLAVVEIIRIGGNPFQGAGQLGLLEGFALLVEAAVALEDAFGVGEAGKVGVGEFVGLFGGELKAIGSELDGRGEDAAQAELAVLALGVDQPGDRAGGGYGAVADDTGPCRRRRIFSGGPGSCLVVWGELALGVLVHGFGGLEGGFFAEVDEGGFAVVGAEEQKSAAAQVAGGGVDDGQGKAGGHGGVDGVSALAQHFEAGVGGQVLDADHHAVRGAHGFLVAIGKHVAGVLLGGGMERDEQRGEEAASEDGESEPSNHTVGDRITRNGAGARRAASGRSCRGIGDWGYHLACSCLATGIFSRRPRFF